VVLTILTLILMASATDSRAQTAPREEAFSTLRLGLGSGAVFRQRGMQGWTPGVETRLTVDTPYAGGRLRFDGAYRAWTGDDAATGITGRDGTVSTADLPDVRTVDVLAGWGLSNATNAPISLDGGLLLGNRFMLFDLPTGTPARFESEMLVGPWVRVGRAIGPMRVFAEARALRVLTRPRWETVGLTGGIALEADSPRWIRWVLR